MQPHRSGFAKRDTLIMIGLFALMIFGLFGLAYSTGWKDTLDALARITPFQILLLLALSLVNYLGRGARWQLFSNRLGLGTTLAQSLRHFIGGFAMTVTPGRLGELVRMRWIYRETGWSFERTAPLVLIDRASDLVAMALVLALSVLMTAGGIGSALPVILLSVVTAYVLTHPQLVKHAASIIYGWIGRFPRLFVKLRRAAASLSAFRTPSTLVLATVLGFAGWFAEGYAFHLLLDWMDANVAMWMAIGIFIISTLAGGVTGAPGGVGGAEAAMVALLSFEGVPLSISVPATLIIRLTTLWFAIVLGLLIFPIAERQSQKGHHANA